MCLCAYVFMSLYLLLTSLASAQETKPFKIRATYLTQDFNFTSQAYGMSLLVSYDKSRSWGIRGGARFLDKFGDQALGYMLGGTWWPTKTTTLSLDIDFAPEQIIIPEQAYSFEVSQILKKVVVPSFVYRFADYSTANVHIMAPGVTWYFYQRFDWLTRYFLSLTQTSGESSWNHSVMSRLTWNMADPVNLFVGYSRANESFESGNVVDPIGDFSADHVFLGGSWEIYRGLGVDFSFDFEKRDNGQKVKTYELGVFYRW